MFEIDIKGLRKILARRGKYHALFELVQNAWDENTSRVDVTLTKPPASRLAFLRVEDNNPDGFADISHAYTLFAESKKKDNPRQRGRFNIGEKLVIALCETSRIITTTAAFEFANNERRSLRRRTETGSVFEGDIRMTFEEFQECCEAMQALLPPEGIATYFNGVLIPSRTPLTVIEETMATETADQEGYLRPTRRQTEIRIYRTQPGETGSIYEMGIPIVETGDDFHADIQQKVPLTIDRDNVTPAFLRSVHTAVLNAVHAHIDPEQANHSWVQDAIMDPNVDTAAVEAVIGHRFGEKAVIFDPSDLEANKRAVAAGYNVIHGSSLPRDAWDNVRRAGFLLPAGQVTPSPKPYGAGPPYDILDPSPHEAKVIQAIERVCHALLGHGVTVHLISTQGVNASATYGPGCPFVLNRRFLGHAFFNNAEVSLTERNVDLVLHELGHEFEEDHLSAKYYHALTRLGAKLALLVKDDPGLLDLA